MATCTSKKVWEGGQYRCALGGSHPGDHGTMVGEPGTASYQKLSWPRTRKGTIMQVYWTKDGHDYRMTRGDDFTLSVDDGPDEPMGREAGMKQLRECYRMTLEDNNCFIKEF